MSRSSKRTEIAGHDAGIVGSTARIATADDADLVARLYRAAIDDCREQRGGIELVGESPAPEAVAALCRREGGFVVLGTFEDCPAGLAIVEVIDRDGPLRGVLRCFFVDPDLRRVGVGEAMLDVVDDDSARVGIVRIDVSVLPGSLPAKAFFETAGFRTRRLTMVRDVGG